MKTRSTIISSRKKHALRRWHAQWLQRTKAAFEEGVWVSRVRLACMKEALHNWRQFISHSHELRRKLHSQIIQYLQRLQRCALVSLREHVQVSLNYDGTRNITRRLKLLKWKRRYEQKFRLTTLLFHIRKVAQSQAFAVWRTHNNLCLEAFRSYLLQRHFLGWKQALEVERRQRCHELKILASCIGSLKANVTMAKLLRRLQLIHSNNILHCALSSWHLATKAGHILSLRKVTILGTWARAKRQTVRRHFRQKEAIFEAWHALTEEALRREAPLRARAATRRALLSWRASTLDRVYKKQQLFAQFLATKARNGSCCSPSSDAQLPLDVTYIYTNSAKSKRICATRANP